MISIFGLSKTFSFTDTQHDAGLLSTVYEAYNRHYNLRTGPEDWWYTIIQTVASAIDNNSKNNQVRKLLN